MKDKDKDRDFLPCGKLSIALLSELMERLPTDDPRLVVGPRVGEDAAVLDFGDRYLIAKTDPITFATDQIGWYAVNINANDVACRGARPRWFLATLLLPEGQTDEASVACIFDQIGDACRVLGITVVGGHTEITHGLSRPIVVGQMLGEVRKDQLVTTAGCQPGDEILLTKGIAIEGTALIAREKQDYLLNRGHLYEEIETAKNYLLNPGISVMKEALIAIESVPVHAMHDPTEGGLATGLWEMAIAAGVRLEVDEEGIELLPESQRLCMEFNLDPLGVLASGALLIVVPKEATSVLLTELSKAGIAAKVIGRTFSGKPEVILKNASQSRPCPLFQSDEITRIFA